MKLEVGKKYRVEDHSEPWEVVAIDCRGIGWGLFEDYMRSSQTLSIISEWHDKPDPGEGWRLLEPDEDVKKGDEWLTQDGRWIATASSGFKPSQYQNLIFRRRRIAPQYVPYTWDDRDELRGRWYRRKIKDTYQREQLACFFYLIDGHFYVNSIRNDELLNECEWLDGTPCGKVVV